MPTFKIIHTDNYNSDYPDEKFVTELPPAMTLHQATNICEAINDRRANMERYYRVVLDDYVLQPGFEP